MINTVLPLLDLHMSDLIMLNFGISNVFHVVSWSSVASMAIFSGCFLDSFAFHLFHYGFLVSSLLFDEKLKMAAKSALLNFKIGTRGWRCFKKLSNYTAVVFNKIVQLDIQQIKFGDIFLQKKGTCSLKIETNGYKILGSTGCHIFFKGLDIKISKHKYCLPIAYYSWHMWLLSLNSLRLIYLQRFQKNF